VYRRPYEEEDYCARCYRGCKSDPAVYAEDPEILAYNVKPEWNFKTTDHCGNDDRYFGIELEMEFSESRFDRVAKEINKHLAGYWIMKRDGSIGEGGELVTAPMTIGALKEINWKELLASLAKLGARSYQTGRCGLHVHVSLPYRDIKRGENTLRTENTLRGMRAFVASQAPWLIPFTKRQPKALSEFAKIPTDWKRTWGYIGGNRYVALNQTPETIEFRLFRGTLDYDRFWASVLLTHAITSFASQISVATCSDPSKGARAFDTFLRSQIKVPHLQKYLAAKCIQYTTAILRRPLPYRMPLLTDPLQFTSPEEYTPQGALEA